MIPTTFRRARSAGVKPESAGWLGGRLHWVVYVALAFLVGTAAPLAPMAALAFLMGAVVIAAFVRPKAFAALTVGTTLLYPTFVQLTGMEALGVVDEAFIIVAAVAFPTARALSGNPFRKLPGATGFVVFLVAGIVGTFVSGAQPSLAAQDAFLLLKGPLFAAAVAQLDWDESDLQRFSRWGGAAVTALLALTVANLVLLTEWTYALTGNPVAYRGNVPALVGPFTHPGVLGQAMVLAAIALAAYRWEVRRTTLSAVLLAGTILGALSSVRRKAIAALVVVPLWLGFNRRPAAVLVLVVSALPPLLILLWPTLREAYDAFYAEYFADPGGTARLVLYGGALQLATAEFPLGVGFSNYGTYIARDSYSPFYYELAFPNVWGLEPGGRFLTDSFWPAIVGEAGFLGGAGFLAGMVALAHHAYAVNRRGGSSWSRWAGLVALGWSLDFAVESVAAPVYVSPPTYLLLFFVIGLTVSLGRCRTPSPAPLMAEYKRGGISNLAGCRAGQELGLRPVRNPQGDVET